MCTLESLLIILSAKNAKDANCFHYIKLFCVLCVFRGLKKGIKVGNAHPASLISGEGRVAR